MDAKKASQVMKPINYTQTKAFKFANWVFLGLVAFSFGMGVLVFQYKLENRGRIKPGYLRRILNEYFQSERVVFQQSRVQGLIPPSVEFLKKQEDSLERLNPLGPKL